MIKVVVFSVCILVIILIFVFLWNIKICDGGELFSGCGKLLYPWSKKIKLSSGKYCCISCYARDIQQFAKIRQAATENPLAKDDLGKEKDDGVY